MRGMHAVRNLILDEVKAALHLYAAKSAAICFFNVLRLRAEVAQLNSCTPLRNSV